MVVHAHELSSAKPKSGVFRKVEVDSPGDTERAARSTRPLVPAGDLLQAEEHRRAGLRPWRPADHVGRCREEGPLGAVAAAVCDDQVVEPIIGIACPGNEVVDLGISVVDALMTVKSTPLLDEPEVAAQLLSRGSRGTEEKIF